MKRWLYAWMLSVLILAGSIDARADAEWPILEGKDLFQIAFPHNPLCTRFDSKTGDGDPLIFQICMMEKDRLTLSLQTALFPAGTDLTPALWGAIDSVAKNFQTTEWTRKQAIRYQRHDAVEAFGAGKDGSLHRVRAVAADGRLYIQVGIAWAGRRDAASLDRFFGSLKLLH